MLALTYPPKRPRTEPRPDSLDLGQRSLTAVFWGGGGSVLRITLQVLTQIALARMLGPAEYGLFAIGAIVIGLSSFFSDVGIAYSLIQKPQVTPQDLRFVFTWQLVLGLLVTALVAGLSGPIALFFGDAQAQGIVAALAVLCLVNALAAPAHNMLKRALDVRRIQLAHLLGYFAGFVGVGIPLALAGANAWALVAAWLVQATSTLAILYAGVRHPLQPLLWFSGARQIVRYGGTVLLTNVTNWLIGNIERVVIARIFATREVGLYATAYNLLFSPVTALVGIVQPVFFSAGARISAQQQRIAHTHLGLTALVTLLVLPVFASVAAIAPTFVLALYGAPWAAAAELVAPLALAMPLYLLWGLSTPLLWLAGAPQLEFRMQLPLALLWLAVAWLAAHHSVAAVAWAVVPMFALRYALILRAAAKLLPMPPADLWRALRGGLLLALLTAGFVRLADAWLLARGLDAAWRLAADVAAGGALYALLLHLLPGLLPAECHDLLARLAARCPRPLARWLARLQRAE